MNIDERIFLEHHGVKGMHWGVRKPTNFKKLFKKQRSIKRDARTARLKAGTATRRDKLIRDADLDRGRTMAVRAGEIKGLSKSARVGAGAAGVVLAAFGAWNINQVSKEIKRGGW